MATDGLWNAVDIQNACTRQCVGTRSLCHKKSQDRVLCQKIAEIILFIENPSIKTINLT